MDHAEEIWNRAVDMDGDDPAAREGDRALRDVLLMHGMTENGGLLNAVEGLEPAEIADAVAGLRWLGMDQLSTAVASFAADAAGLEDLSDEDADALEERGNELYDADDAAVDAAFRRRLAEQPDAFAPLS